MNAGDTLGAGRYRLTRRLGHGGFGKVYEADDTLLDRTVAIKVLTLDGSEGRERFLREAQAVARLSHPHIVAIHDIVAEGDLLYIVQELVRGESLDVVIGRHGRLPIRWAVSLLVQVGEALAFAHDKGVIHRDVKPGNVVVLAPWTAKLLDFGVAKLPDRDAITGDGTVGTPAYMAPEQLQGLGVDARADVFAFGAVAFEALSGKRLFQADSALAAVLKIVQEPLPNLADAMPEAPLALVDLLGRCLERDRERRPPSMGIVVAELRRVLDALGPGDDATAAPPLLAPKAPDTRPSAPPVAPAATSATPVTRPARADGTRAGPVLPLPGEDGRSGPVSPSPFRAAWPGDDAVLASGTRVGKFTVHELVAHGQTGHLYKAYDPVRARLIGLKVIRNPTGPAVDRLMRASRIWLELRHPNLQTVLEVDPGDENGVALIATELIQGVDLERLQARRQLELIEKIGLVIQLCEALDYMHLRGIIHREVAPRNIVVAEPGLQLTLLDSGLARSTDDAASTMTQMGVIVGSLRYMAPEQAQGRYDQRSDIYAVGVVLFELLTGERFDAAQADAARARIAQGDGIPSKLARTLLTAIERDPDKRFGGVRELADGLRALVPDKTAPPSLSDVVVTLHGIRTHARWQRTFSEVAMRSRLHCRLDRWNFGYFSVFQFVMPWSRQAKVYWFRSTYHDEFGDQATSPLSVERPSIVAHSFGTYILGNALLRYPYLRFDKVLLCGSILPREFPWDVLVDRGQVQAIRNEYGARDVWTQVAQWFVPGTGPSGLVGFDVRHERVEQERFDFSHSEYFERGHMEDKWIPFVKRRFRHITPRDRTADAPRGARPIGLYLLYAVVILAVIAAVLWWR